MRRRVLFLTTEWPSDESAVSGIFVREFAVAASQAADVEAVHVLRAPGRRGLYELERLDDGVPLTRVRYRRFGKPASVLAFVLGTRAAIAGRRFDVVHTHSFLATLLAKLLLPRTPVVYTEQWSVFLDDSPYELRRAMRPLAKLALRQARIVLPPSRAMLVSLARLAPGARFRVVPNVVDTSLFAPRAHEHGRRIVSVGMMPPTHVKGFDVLLEAMHDVSGATLDVVGDGPMRSEYEARANGLPVRFHGLQPKTRIAELMRESDLFVLASRFDNSPCVVIEAMASGLPVVATRVGGVPELIDAETGLVVDPQDAHALATAVEHALDNLATYDAERIAELARDRHGRAHIAAELAAVYDEAAR
jgi:glycosyltransferase involved in cell wall biosynthesis